ncbi:LacI family DNA-binding transcriptional regulator [Nonomuraea pusilla]|uniref:LacI family DNA-binding transcriptional regulator n=1 Tax=Nonomuraea pusilla TaxID=46177 RepID=UPI000B85A549|nr:LacI family DNA-binding transcriptional regulator [Nonomuraea pusilla]
MRPKNDGSDDRPQGGPRDRPRDRPAALGDVAVLAGVSATTVSRALTGGPRTRRQGRHGTCPGPHALTPP